jgi:hypothetical protein
VDGSNYKLAVSRKSASSLRRRPRRIRRKTNMENPDFFGFQSKLSLGRGGLVLTFFLSMRNKPRQQHITMEKDIFGVKEEEDTM